MYIAGLRKRALGIQPLKLTQDHRIGGDSVVREHLTYCYPIVSLFLDILM